MALENPDSISNLKKIYERAFLKDQDADKRKNPPFYRNTNTLHDDALFAVFNAGRDHQESIDDVTLMEQVRSSEKEKSDLTEELNASFSAADVEKLEAEYEERLRVLRVEKAQLIEKQARTSVVATDFYIKADSAETRIQAVIDLIDSDPAFKDCDAILDLLIEKPAAEVEAEETDVAPNKPEVLKTPAPKSVPVVPKPAAKVTPAAPKAPAVSKAVTGPVSTPKANLPKTAVATSK